MAHRLPDPGRVYPELAQAYAECLLALAEEIAEEGPGPVGYADEVAYRRGHLAAVNRVRFRGLAYRRRWLQGGRS